MSPELSGRGGPLVIVVMGTTGAGKTTVGKQLAERLGWRFAEGDDYHPQANIEKMGAGRPLDDVDREPWLDAMRADIEEWLAKGESAVLACSALKRAYRERLAGEENVVFVYLKGRYEEIEDRIESREDHFAKVDLLESQFEALEEPGRDEAAIVVPVSASPEESVEMIVGELGLQPPS